MDVMKSKSINVKKVYWKILSKANYLLIANLLSQLTEKQYPELKCYVDITLLGPGTSIEYDLDEFQKHFSDSSTEYENLSITSSCPEKQFWISFKIHQDSFCALYASSQTHTLAQLEDLLNKCEEAITLLYQNRLNVLKLPEKQLESDKPDDDGSREDSHAIATNSNKNAPFYKSGIFWAAVGSVVSIVSLVVTIVFKFQQL